MKLGSLVEACLSDTMLRFVVCCHLFWHGVFRPDLHCTRQRVSCGSGSCSTLFGGTNPLFGLATFHVCLAFWESDRHRRHVRVVAFVPCFAHDSTHNGHKNPPLPWAHGGTVTHFKVDTGHLGGQRTNRARRPGTTGGPEANTRAKLTLSRDYRLPACEMPWGLIWGGLDAGLSDSRTTLLFVSHVCGMWEGKGGWS